MFAPAGDELAHATRALVHGALQRFLGDLMRVEDVTVVASRRPARGHGHATPAAGPGRGAAAGGPGLQRVREQAVAGPAPVPALVPGLVTAVDREARRALVEGSADLEGVDFVEVVPGYVPWAPPAADACWSTC